MFGGFMTVAIAPTASTDIDNQPLLLDVRNTVLTVTPEQFDRLCTNNPDLRLELTPNRELIVMAPAGGESSEKNGDLVADVIIWNRQTNLGRVFDSSGGYDFTALGGGKPAPDVSWIEKSRLELRSATDNLKPLQEKMKEYQRLGVRLGLLVNPKNKQLEVYRPGQEVDVLEAPGSIDCNEVMPGFVLSLSKMW
jgi:Uma2 family endonuclease